tara:strand:- start:1595 stop:1801 length:207 start_codon:yes stop_codon:yes gene_type:complete
MSYKNMTKLACFIAPAGMDGWDRTDIEMMVDACGWEAAEDFFARYENTFGVRCAQQRAWIAELEEMEE